MRADDLSWIRRRARRLQRAFTVTRRRAVRQAAQDWWQMHGQARSVRGAAA